MRIFAPLPLTSKLDALYGANVNPIRTPFVCARDFDPMSVPPHEKNREPTGICHGLICAYRKTKANLSLGCSRGERVAIFSTPTQQPSVQLSGFNSLSVPQKRKVIGVRMHPYDFWWNRRESNPCPKITPYNLLRRQSVC